MREYEGYHPKVKLEEALNECGLNVARGSCHQNACRKKVMNYQSGKHWPKSTTRVVCLAITATVLLHLTINLQPAYGQPQATETNGSSAAGVRNSLTADAPSIKPVAFEGDAKVVRLPSNIAAACMAGGGRFLLLHLKEINKIAVFDICEARIAKFLPAPDGTFAMAGGLTSAVTLDKTNQQATRWSLIDFKLEQQQAVSKDIDRVVMGCSSRGPVYALEQDYSGWNVGFLSLSTLAPLPVQTVNDRPFNERMDIDLYPNVRVSADGTALVGSRGLYDSCTVVRYRNGRVLQQRHRLPSRLTETGVVMPLADGSGFAGSHNCYARHFIPTKVSKTAERLIAAPAPNGNLFLSLSPQGNSIHAGPGARLVALAADVPVPPIVSRYKPGELRLEDRVYFVPAARVVVILPAAGSDVTLQRMNELSGELKPANAMAYFTSSPPVEASRRGFRYIVKTAGAANPVYQLVVKPPGMTISQEGEILWQPPRTGAATSQRVVVRVTAPGNTIFQSFTLKIDAGEPWPPGYRFWREYDGEQTAEARITGFERGHLSLTRRDGREFTAPLSHFSKEDQVYVKELLQPYKAEPAYDAPPEPE